MPAAGSLSRVGQHGIDQFYNHQHPQVRIEAAHCQTNHLASSAGHHAETQHNRPAGARTGLAAPRRPSLVVQKICRIGCAVDDDDLAGTTSSPDERSDIRGRRQTNVTLPHVAPLMRATNGLLRPALPLRQQRFAHLLEFAAVGLVDFREMQVEPVERRHDRRADHHAGEPFVVGRHDVPWRMLG